MHGENLKLIEALNCYKACPCTPVTMCPLSLDQL